MYPEPTRLVTGTHSVRHSSNIPSDLFYDAISDCVFRVAILVVSEKGEIRFKNPQATAILTSEEMIFNRNGFFFINSAAVQRSFKNLVERAVLASAEEQCRCEVIGVPDRGGAVRYALRTVGVSERDGRTEVVISIIDFNDYFSPSRETFAAVFCLSAREAEFAELFVRGFRVDEIAALMGIALNTSRIHLRRLFLKTNCSGQIALMRRLCRLVSFCNE